MSKVEGNSTEEVLDLLKDIRKEMLGDEQEVKNLSADFRVLFNQAEMKKYFSEFNKGLKKAKSELSKMDSSALKSKIENSFSSLQYDLLQYEAGIKFLEDIPNLQKFIDLIREFKQLGGDTSALKLSYKIDTSEIDRALDMSVESAYPRMWEEYSDLLEDMQGRSRTLLQIMEAIDDEGKGIFDVAESKREIESIDFLIEKLETLKKEINVILDNPELRKEFIPSDGIDDLLSSISKLKDLLVSIQSDPSAFNLDQLLSIVGEINSKQRILNQEYKNGLSIQKESEREASAQKRATAQQEEIERQRLLNEEREHQIELDRQISDFEKYRPERSEFFTDSGFIQAQNEYVGVLSQLQNELIDLTKATEDYAEKRDLVLKQDRNLFDADSFKSIYGSSASEIDGLKESFDNLYSSILSGQKTMYDAGEEFERLRKAAIGFQGDDGFDYYNTDGYEDELQGIDKLNDESSELLRTLGDIRSELEKVRKSIGFTDSELGLDNIVSSLRTISNALSELSGKFNLFGDGLENVSINLNIQEDKTLEGIKMEEKRRQYIEKTYQTYLKYYEKIQKMAKQYYGVDEGAIYALSNSRAAGIYGNDFEAIRGQFGYDAITDSSGDRIEQISKIQRFIELIKQAAKEATPGLDEFWDAVSGMKVGRKLDMSTINSALADITEIKSKTEGMTQKQNALQDLFGGMTNSATDLSEIKVLLEDIALILKNDVSIGSEKVKENIKEIISVASSATTEIRAEINAISQLMNAPVNEDVVNNNKQMGDVAEQTTKAVLDLRDAESKSVTTNESDAISALLPVLTEVIAKIGEKTNAFREEESVVSDSVSSEIESLSKLSFTIEKIVEQLREMSSINVKLDIDSESLQNLTGSIGSLDLSDIGDILNHSKELENLAKVLSSAGKIDKVKEAVGSQEIDQDLVRAYEDAEKTLQYDRERLAAEKELNKERERGAKQRAKIEAAIDADINKTKEQYEALKRSIGERISGGKYTDDVVKQQYGPLLEQVEQIDQSTMRFHEFKAAVETASNKLTEFDEANNKNKDSLKASDVAIDKLNGRIQEFINNNSKMGKSYAEAFRNIANGLEYGMSKSAYEDALKSTIQLEARIQSLKLTGKSTFELLSNRIKQMSVNFIAMYFSFYDMIRYGRQVVTTIKDIDTAITELRKVSDASDARLDQSFEKSAKTAKELGAAINDVINMTADWSRLGYSVDQSEELARATTLMKNVSENITAEDASSYLISTLQGFNLEAENAVEIIDKYNNVANHMPISTAGIGEALQRSAASFRAANTDLSESIALVTTANSVLQNPEMVGTTFKTLSARLRGAKTELEDLGFEEEELAVTTSKLRETIMSMTGFDIMEDEDTYKSIYEILLGIGKEWDNLTDVERASLGEMLAGKRNSNALYAVLQNTEMLEEAYELAEDSAGSAEREQENYMKSIQYSLDRFTASWQELQADLIDSGFIKLVVDTGTTVVNILDKIVEGTHGVAAGVALIAGGYVWFNKVIREGQKAVDLHTIATNIDTAANEANAQSQRNQAAASALVEANLISETAAQTAETASDNVDTAANEANRLSQINQAIGNTATAAGTAIATGAKTAATGIKSVATAVSATVVEFLPLIAVVAAAGVAIAGLVDLATVSADEARENLNKSNQKLGEINSELTETSSKIDDIKSKLEDKNYLSVTDPEDIDRLKAELAYLEKREEFLNREQQRTQDEAAKNAYEAATKSQFHWNTANGPVAHALGIGGFSAIEEAENLVDKIEKKRAVYERDRDAWTNGKYRMTEAELTKQEDKIAELESEGYESVQELLALRDEMAKDSTGKYKSEIARIDSLLNYFTKANDEAVKDAQETADEIAQAYSNIDILSGIQGLEKGMDQIDKIYADVMNGEDFDFSSILNNEDFEKTFSGLDGAFEQFGDAYTNFVETVANNPDDIQATQEAFDNLASAYIWQSAQLDKVTEETKDATVEMLKQMGVVNAEEVVTTALANNMADLAFEEDVLKANSIDLASVTSAEIAKLEQEGKVSADAADKISLLAMQKQFVNRNEIWTANDVQQLVNLAEQAGITGGALEKLAQLKAQLAQAEKYKGDSSSVLGNVLIGANATQKTGLQAQIDATANELQKIAKTRIGKTKIEMPQIQYGGGSSTQSAIDKAAGSAKDASEEFFDYFERRVEVLNQAIELLGANLENVLGSVAKNQLLDSQRGIYRTELDEYAAALDMYQEKANEFLVKLPADIQQKIVNGAVALQDFVGDSEGEVLDAIKSYQEWANKVADCRQKLAELKETLRQLELQKFNNIVDDFTKQFDIRENNAVDIIDKQIALFQEAGELIGESFYAEQKEQSLKQLDILNREKEALLNQLGTAMANGIAAGDDEWNEMISTLSDLDGKILDCKTSVEKFDNAILQIHDDVFKRIQDQFSSFVNELSNARALFEDFDVANIFNEWTENGLAQLGLASQEYELAIHRVQQYEDEIDLLNKQYMDGRYSATEYADKLIELKNAQWDAVSAAESAKDTIMSLNETRVEIVVEGINKEIEAYKKATDAMIENLQATEDLHDYQKSIAEANRDITKMERQLAAMQNDDTAATIAKRKKLEEQLAQAREDLAEKERDHEVETRIDALNKQYEQFEEEKNNEITALQEGLKARELIIAGSLDAVKENALVIGETINQMTQAHGVVMSEALIGAWTAGENAIASYGNVLNANSSQFISNIIGVENETWNLQAKANQTSVALSNMFGNRADALVEEMNRAYYSAENLNNVAYSIQNSFSNAFSSYDTNGIVSSLNTVKAAAENTARALQNANAANNVSIMDGAKIVEKIGKNVKLQGNYSFGSGSSRNFRDYTQYAYAGGVHKLDKDELAWTQELGDEVILSPTRNAILTPLRQGDSVLTAKQSEALFQWAKTSPAEFMRKAIAGKTVVPASNVGDMKLEIGNVLTVNGNIDDTNVKRMESVAQDAINKAFVQLKNGLKR